jgi:hypothetical protein
VFVVVVAVFDFVFEIGFVVDYSFRKTFILYNFDCIQLKTKTSKTVKSVKSSKKTKNFKVESSRKRKKLNARV